MPIIEPVIRPPAEAASFLLQVTTGCSANGCAFCGAYLGKPFTVKSRAEVSGDIRDWRRQHPGERRIFLLDGDALAVPNHRLIPILQEAAAAFPKLTRIAAYVNGYNLTNRTGAELLELYQHKLRLIYLGLESGSQTILDLHRKRSTAAEMVEGVRRAQSAGIKVSVMVLLGLGGQAGSKRHVRETVAALNRMQPRYLSFLTLMAVPGTELWRRIEAGQFTELGPEEMLSEARAILAGLDLRRTIFRMDHASNHLSLEGRLPTDQGRLLRTLDDALAGRLRLKPEFLRDL